MNVRRVVVPLAVMVVIGLFVGCGGGDKSATSEMERAADDAMEAAGDAADSAVEMAEETADDAAAMIENLKQELAEKEDEFTKLADQIKNLSPTDTAGSVGQDLMEKSEALSGEIQALKDKIASYM